MSYTNRLITTCWGIAVLSCGYCFRSSIKQYEKVKREEPSLLGKIAELRKKMVLDGLTFTGISSGAIKWAETASLIAPLALPVGRALSAITYSSYLTVSGVRLSEMSLKREQLVKIAFHVSCVAWGALGLASLLAQAPVFPSASTFFFISSFYFGFLDLYGKKGQGS